MPQPADFIEEQLPEGGAVLRLGGTLAISQIGDLDARLRATGAEVRQIDLSQIDHIDTVGAWLVDRTARDPGAHGRPGQGAPDRVSIQPLQGYR